MATTSEIKTGWMVQTQDDNGQWLDYQWTDDPDEERSMVRHLRRHGNHTRTVIKGDPCSERAVYVVEGEVRYAIDCVPRHIRDERIERLWQEAGGFLRMWFPERDYFPYWMLVREAEKLNPGL